MSNPAQQDKADFEYSTTSFTWFIDDQEVMPLTTPKREKGWELMSVHPSGNVNQQVAREGHGHRASGGSHTKQEPAMRVLCVWRRYIGDSK
jgi:hypothetical protein